MTDENGMGAGEFLLWWAAAGLLLKAWFRAEEEAWLRSYADALGITTEEARRRLDGSLPKPKPQLHLHMNSLRRVKVRRLTHAEAWSALRQGRYLEACRERVKEAEVAAEGGSARVHGK